jgi:hypothetical protein
MEKQRKNKKKLTGEQIMTLWLLHESEQLKEKLSKEDVDEINQYIRKLDDPDLWEVDYDD